MGLTDRLRTPQGVAAILSPRGMLLAGLGAGVAVLVGAPVALAVAVCAAAWGATVAVALPRRTKVEQRIPLSLADPWRSYVVDAQVAKLRFDEIAEGMEPGPLHDRLLGLGRRLDAGVAESWRIATRGNDLMTALKRLAPDRARRDLVAAQRELEGADATPASAHVVEALQAQVDAAERLERTADQARDRLRVLNARFQELVARAVEVSVGVGDEQSLGGDVDELVTELEALRRAIEETSDAEVERPDSPVSDLAQPWPAEPGDVAPPRPATG